MASSATPSLPTPKPRSTQRNRTLPFIYSVLLLAVILLASVSVYNDLFPSPHHATSEPTFSIANVSLSFSGPSASNLTLATSWCPRCWEGTYAAEAPLRITAGVALVPAAASCSLLGDTILYEVDTPSTGGFQIENVSWNGTSLPGSGYLPGPGAHLPYGNSSVCDSTVDLLITLRYIGIGPSEETLSLTADWTYATLPPP